MGYDLRCVKADFFIPVREHPYALSALWALAEARPLSWQVDKDIIKAATLVEALQGCMWPVRQDASYNIVGIDFEGENAGDDDLIFGAIARFVREGSYIECLGNGGDDRWRWLFRGGALVRQVAAITWADENGREPQDTIIAVNVSEVARQLREVPKRGMGQCHRQQDETLVAALGPEVAAAWDEVWERGYS